MAAITTPRAKKLAVSDQIANRSSSTPPTNRNKSLLTAPLFVSPSSRHSSPGIDRLWNGRHYADDVIPRRLTASPVARRKDTDRIRRRLQQHYSIDHAVELLRDAKNIVVLTGAGISTSLDIPDFRSDDGFYSRLSSRIGVSEPEEFFSMDFFKHNSEAFWDNVKALLPRHAKDKTGEYTSISSKYDTNTDQSKPRFSKAHAFLALLNAKSKLLTNYTQNIDGLEYAAGVSEDRITQCHGSWDTATCLSCRKTIPAKKYLPIVYEDGYPRCKCGGTNIPEPMTPSPKKRAKKRKRHIFEGDSDHDSDDGTKTPVGLYKPDITFFGESIPDDYVSRLQNDKTKIDLLLIVGTSLKVRPVKTMVLEFPPHVPQIWINRDRFSGYMCDMPGVQLDIELLGECDLVVEELCSRAGLDLNAFIWKRDTESIIPSRPREDIKLLPAGELTPADEVKEASIQDVTDTHILSEQPEKKVPESKPHTPADEKAKRFGILKSSIRVESDLDAEWRWRFIRKPVT